jgi:xanthine dehydrogenase YagR molybdenum-binding subunit
MTTAFIGQPLSRVDGRQKVTGGATYAAEFHVPGLAHAAIVRSTVAKGRLTAIDTAAAERAPGVVAVLTHRNAPRLAYRPHKAAVDPDVGERLHVLQDDQVSHQGQPIALVVAETLEQATHAATLVRVTYAPDTATTDIRQVEPVLPTCQQTDQGERRPAETRRGDPEGALAAAEVKVDQSYVIPREHHNPMELHATIAAWDGDRLTLWDKTQWVYNTADEIAAVFGMPAEHIRVVSPFVGGAFGSALRAWPHVTLAALGARVAGRPVKVMLSRREMYYGVGFRPHTVQRVALGASRDGRLAAIVHDGHQETSTYEEFSEALLNASRFLYSCGNVYTRHRLAPLNVHTPTFMRAPGEASGNFALESALDELAVALHLDPVELRLRNEPEQDEFRKLPFSSRSTRECYRVAAERFGWSRRTPEPRSMRDGRWLLGWGMATATYPMNYAPASATARLLPDGTAEVTSAASDMGPGTWTSMTQVAAEALGLPIERVTFRLGDTRLPRGPRARRLDDDGERRQCRAGRLPPGAGGRARTRRRQRPRGGHAPPR